MARTYEVYRDDSLYSLYWRRVSDLRRLEADLLHLTNGRSFLKLPPQTFRTACALQARIDNEKKRIQGLANKLNIKAVGDEPLRTQQLALIRVK